MDKTTLSPNKYIKGVVIIHIIIVLFIALMNFTIKTKIIQKFRKSPQSFHAYDAEKY